MNGNASQAGQEIETFEEYTLYSLERSTPTLLHMMERSKRVAGQWPEVPALLAAAGLCKEVAGLASYQETLDNVFGFSERTDAVGEEWKAMRARVQLMMDSLTDALTLNEPGPIKRLFAVEIPDALNRFVDLIPVVSRHVRESYMTEPAASATVGSGGEG